MFTHQLRNQLNYGNMSKYSDKELSLHIVGRNCIGFPIAIKFAMCFDISVLQSLYKMLQ